MARKGTFTATFTFNGKRYYAYGKTQREADIKAGRKQRDLESAMFTPTKNVSVEEWSELWLENYKKGSVGDAWYKQTKSAVAKYILPEIGDKLLKEVTASDIHKLMNGISKFSESHQRKIAQILGQIFTSAVDNNLIMRTPVTKIKIAHKPSHTPTRPITAKERALSLAVADKYPNEGIFILIVLYCGCRPQEVSRLRMKDYDPDTRVLHIHEARKADGSTGAPKSVSGIRDVPVPTYLAERLDKIKKKPNDLIVTSAQGKPLTKTSQKRLWRRFRRYMDIENGAETFRGSVVQSTIAEDLRPYCYRHTYCTDLQDAGVPITVARRLMGHADIKTTALIYTHHSEKSFEDAREKINALHK